MAAAPTNIKICVSKMMEEFFIFSGKAKVPGIASLSSLTYKSKNSFQVIMCVVNR